MLADTTLRHSCLTAVKQLWQDCVEPKTEWGNGLQQLNQVSRQRKNGPENKWIDMATSYVVKHGFNDLSLTAMAKELGITKQALNYQFGSRDQLLKLLIETFQTEIFSFADQIRCEMASVEGMFQAMEKRFLEDRSRSQVWLEMVILSTRKPELFAGFGQRSRERWLNIFRELFMADGCPESKLTPLLDLVMNQFNGAILDYLIRNDINCVRASMALFVDMYSHQKCHW